MELEAIHRLLMKSEANGTEQQAADFSINREGPVNREEQADRETLWATKHY